MDNSYFAKNFRHLTPFDLKAEVLFDALLKDHIQDLDIVLNARGLFFRKYNKDIMNIIQDVNDPDILNVETSRDSFYDILPESITHNYKNRDYREDAVQEFKTRKKEEKEARHFFNPLENELFRFRHAVEKYESDFFSAINTNGIADIIRMILGVEKPMPDALLVKMFYALMKQKDSSAQDIANICTILENILGENVTYISKNIKLDHVFDIAEEPEDMIMGINTTLASSEYIFLKRYHFTVGPLQNPQNLPLYFSNQVLENFLNTFFNLFIPFQLQYSFEIQLNHDDELFAMDDTMNYKSRLGISTVL
jgi:hypothetical protein